MNNKNLKNIIISKSNDVMAFLNRERTYMNKIRVNNIDTKENFICNTSVVYNKFESIYLSTIKNKDYEDLYNFDDFKSIKFHIILEKDGNNHIPLANIYINTNMYAILSLESLLNDKDSDIIWQEPNINFNYFWR